MEDYKSMYFRLTAKLADAIESLELISESLKKVQREEELVYIAGRDTSENA